jgi:hypothetical protein
MADDGSFTSSNIYDDEGEVEAEAEAEAEEDADPKVTGSARLAWMFVEGWRKRLRVAGDIIEQKRWEWSMADMKNMSVPSLATASTSAARNNTTDKTDEQEERKSARWSL